VVVSQAPAELEKPLVIELQYSSGLSSGLPPQGTLHVGELSPDSDTGAQRFLAVMALSFQTPPNSGHERLAVQSMLSATSSDEHVPIADQVKAGFREANRAVFGALDDVQRSDSAGVAMLALLTSGKYAALGLVGNERAYLARGSRLTQLTRDQRVARARSRRKQDIDVTDTATGPQPVRLLGEADRLEPRSPAIFEITLLPEDRLALLSHDLVERLGEESIHAGLVSGAADPQALVASTQQQTRGALLAAVLSVAPAREPSPVGVASAGPSRSAWLFLIPLAVALAVIAVLILLLI
jgi:serine/threonine protein phosphatase PrpC